MMRLAPFYVLLFTLLSALQLQVVAQPHLLPETIEVAPLDKALTFARTYENGELVTLAILTYTNNQVKAVNLNKVLNSKAADAIDLFNQHGYVNIKNGIEQALLAERYLYLHASALTLPIHLKNINIAAGTNYKAHAEETDVTKTPFLFSKRVQPTSAYSNVPLTTQALDWEVEMAFVPLNDLTEDVHPTYLGLILTNDFSNREILMHNVNIKNIESAKGFAQGKSAPGLLPVGNLFVIPKDYRSFSQSIHLTLNVNDQVKQQAFSKQMIWDADKIISEIWKAKYQKWQYKNEAIGLLSQPDKIVARTLILSGTPEGTAFQGVGLFTKLKGLTSWLASGFTETVQFHVVNAYLEEAKQEKRFLQSGDRVSIKANYLGVLENVIGVSKVALD